MNTPTPSLLLEIEALIWRHAEQIGRPQAFHATREFNPEQLTAYAAGLRHAYTALAENLGVGPIQNLNQLDAALGEAFERMRAPQLQFFIPVEAFPAPELAPLAHAIRQARIKLRDQYELPFDLLRFQQEIAKLERERVQANGNGAPYWEHVINVKEELRALQDMRAHQLADPQWYARHVEETAEHPKHVAA